MNHANETETLSALQAFRARNINASNKNAALKSTMPQLDLSHYKSILKNASAVEAAEKALSSFKPVDYDVSKWDKVVDAFEQKAVSQAKETVQKVDKEETDLKATLSNITEARPFEDLTSDEAAAANPEISKATEVSRTMWQFRVGGGPRCLLHRQTSSTSLLPFQKVASLTLSQAMLKNGRWTVPGAFTDLRALSRQERAEDVPRRVISWGGVVGAPHSVPCLATPNLVSSTAAHLLLLHHCNPLRTLFLLTSSSSDAPFHSKAMLTTAQGTPRPTVFRASSKYGLISTKCIEMEATMVHRRGWGIRCLTQWETNSDSRRRRWPKATDFGGQALQAPPGHRPRRLKETC